MMNLPMRCWAEIDLDALTQNIQNIKKLVAPSTRIMGVVKADAYGHGALMVSRTLLENGATDLAVASVDEGVFLRHHGFDCPILLLGTPFPEDADLLVENGLSVCATNLTVPTALSEAAEKLNKTASVHIKVDTGMNRLGFLSRSDISETVASIKAIAHLPHLSIDGIFTHFARADEENGTDYTSLQFERFMNICYALEAEGIHIPLRHVANSAAIMDYPEYQLEMVRPGIILYGCYPSDEVNKEALPLRPVMTLKSRVSHIKTLSAGEAVSYGSIYETPSERVIATVPIGYADGWNRRLSGQVIVSVRRQKVSVVGRICMDQCMIDVTSVKNISVGDEVVLFGGDAESVTEIATRLSTISYEILCNISKRVPRVYIKNSLPVETADPVNFLA